VAGKGGRGDGGTERAGIAHENFVLWQALPEHVPARLGLVDVAVCSPPKIRGVRQHPHNAARVVGLIDCDTGDVERLCQPKLHKVVWLGMLRRVHDAAKLAPLLRVEHRVG
jgi:hypothetical protein